jgi:hypothetical protein
MIEAMSLGARENMPSSARLKWPALGTGLGTETRVKAISSTPKACGGFLIIRAAGARGAGYDDLVL